MADFLFRFLQMSAVGSLMAGLIFLWHRFLRKEAINTIFYYMWLLVLLRLCVPFGVTVSLPVVGEWAFESERRLEDGGAERLASAEKSDAAGKDQPEFTGKQGAAGKDRLEFAGKQGAAGKDQPEFAGKPGAAENAPRLSDAGNVLREAGRGFQDFLSIPWLWVLLWSAGAVVCLGRYVTGYVRFYCAVKRAALEASPKAQEVLCELDPDGRVRILECPFAATPMLMGLLRPTIVLPVGVEDKQRLKDIVTHELVHARRHDLLYKWFAVAVTSLHWFNPVMILVRREIGRACELSCDEAVMRGMDGEERLHYGETLLSLAAAHPGGSRLVTMTLCEEKKQLKERLVSIAAYRKKGAAAVLVSVYVLIFLCSCGTISGADFVRADAPEEKAGGSASGMNPAGESEAVDMANAGAADVPQDSANAGNGSEDDGSDGNRSKTAVLLREALLGERPILCANGEAAPVSMNIDDVPDIFDPHSEYAKIWQFTVIDLDGDGEEEAVLRILGLSGDMGGCLVLHCADDEVLGFATSYQTFEVLKADGTYNGRGGEILDGVCRMGFEGNTCTFDWLISCTFSDAGEQTEQEEGYPELSYYVKGASVSEEEWSAAVNEQGEKEDAEWSFYSKAAVERLLTEDGGLPFEYTPDDAEAEDGTGKDSKTSDQSRDAREKKDPEDMYQFPVRVSDTRLLTVVLDTSEPEKNYFSVERIYVYDGDTLIQTIEAAKLTLPQDYLWEGLFVNKGHAEGEPDVRDVNFDGAEDFGLLCAASYPKNLPFTYFYWFEPEGKFVQGFTIFGGRALEVDEEQKCLIEHWYDVNGEHTTRYA